MAQKETEPKAYTMRDMLLQHFAPATSEEKAQMKTTSDIFNILDEHAPGRFSRHDLFDLLRNEGFADKLVGDTLIWLVAGR